MVSGSKFKVRVAGKQAFSGRYIPAQYEMLGDKGSE
jgi:hypothetical protein